MVNAPAVPAPTTPTAPTAPATPPLPDVLPVLPLGEAVVFPLAVVPLAVGQERAVRLVDEAMRADRLLTLVAQRATEAEAAAPAGPDDVYRIGTAAVIRQLARAPDGALRLVVQGLERVRLLDFTATDPYLVARVEPAPDQAPASPETEGLRRAILDLFRSLVGLIEPLPGELVPAAEGLSDARQVAYLVASVVPLETAARQEVLELDPLDAKLRRLIDLLQHELAIRELGRKIATETQERLSKAQREYFLREQLKFIQAELGEGEAPPELAALH
ncbi:MAG: LON peptidase substrate-binding domain-containing protein, partial [Chloroflexota bacterium]